MKEESMVDWFFREMRRGEIIEAFNVLHKAGIQMIEGSCYFESGEEAALYALDKDAFYARKSGYPKKQYVEWSRWDDQCKAITKKGKPCRIGVSRPYEPGPNMNHFCSLHKRR